MGTGHGGPCRFRGALRLTFITTDPERELDSLTTVINQASSWLETISTSRLNSRNGELLAAIRNAKSQPFYWGTPDPIQTKVSRQYKGENNNAAHGIYAQFSFEWRLQLIPNQKRRFSIIGGGCKVEISSDANVLLRDYHFDTCQGGIDHGSAHHPCSHFQYNANGLSDLPRLPSLIVTPTDVLEQVLLDLWPSDWVEKAARSKTKAALNGHYSNQRKRIRLLADQFASAAATASVPLRGLQSKLTSPLDLAI